MALQEMKDFSFLRMRQISLFPGKEIGTVQASLQRSKIGLRLVTACNRFGLIFCLTPGTSRLIGFPSSELHKLVAKKDNATIPVRLDEIQGVREAKVPTNEVASSVSCSCDGLTIAVTTSKGGSPFVLFYDARSFSAQNSDSITPFVEARVSAAAGAELTDFQWNPALNNDFCASASDGTLLVGQVNETGTFSITASKNLAGSYAASVCWSPKGKQFVAAKSDGSLEQFTPALVSARLIPAPTQPKQISDDTNLAGPFSCINVQWLSTLQFATVYTPVSAPQQLYMTILSVPKDKTGKPTWKAFEDVCFAQGEFLLAKYIFHHIPNWNLLICASSNAQEAAVIGASRNGPEAVDSTTWNLWDLDESARAELPAPLESSGSPVEPHCIGTTIDLTSKAMIRISETQSYDPSPILVMYSTDGFLVPYHIINRIPSYKEISSQMTKSPEALALEGMRKGLPPPPSVSTLSTGARPQAPNPIAPAAAATSVSPGPSPVTQVQAKPSLATSRAEPIANSTIPEPVKSAPAPIQEAPKESAELLQLRKFVWNERQQFEVKLAKLKAIIQQRKTVPRPIGSKEEMIQIPKDVHDLSEQKKLLEKQSETIVQDKNEIVQWALTSLMSGDETKSIFEHRNGSEFKYLMRHKPLDMVQQRKLDDFKSRVAYVEEQSSHLDSRLQAASFVGTRGKSKKSLATVNSVMMINRTISNMQGVITELTQRLYLLESNSGADENKKTPQNQQIRRSLLGNIANLSRDLENTKISAQKLTESTSSRRIFDSPSTLLDSSSSFVCSPKFAAKMSESKRSLLEKEKSHKLNDTDLARLEILLRDQQATPIKTMIPDLKPAKFKWHREAETSSSSSSMSRPAEKPLKPAQPLTQNQGMKMNFPKPPQTVFASQPVSQPVNPMSMKNTVTEPPKTTMAPLPKGTFAFKTLVKTDLKPTAPTPTSNLAMGKTSTGFGAAPSFGTTATQKPLLPAVTQPAKPFTFGNLPGIQNTPPSFGATAGKGAVKFLLGGSPSKPETEAAAKPESPATPVSPRGRLNSPLIPKATSTPASTSLAGLAALARFQNEPIPEKPAEEAASPLPPVQKTPEVAATVSFPAKPKETTASAVSTLVTPSTTSASAAVESLKPALQPVAPSLTPPPATTEPQPAAPPQPKEATTTEKKETSAEPVVLPLKPSAEIPKTEEAEAVEPLKKDEPATPAAPKLPEPDGDTMEMVDDEPLAPTATSDSASKPAGGFSFAQPPTNANPAASGGFGGGSPFGSGGFFSGLGGKPSDAAAKGNVFGGAGFGSSPAASTPLQGGGIFGSKSGFGTSSPLSSGGFGANKAQGSPSAFGGSFSSGGGGGVASQGFGAFGAASPVSSPGTGFGQKPAFGGSPSSGGNTSFGAKPAFGGGAGFGGFRASSPSTGSAFGGGATFGGAAAAPATGGFAALAQQSGPTFGSLAAGGGGGSTFGGFGSTVPSTQPSSGSIFGGSGTTGPAFGGSTQGSFAQWR